jgi:hypothetical protein
VLRLSGAANPGPPVLADGWADFFLVFDAPLARARLTQLVNASSGSPTGSIG